MDEWQEVPFSKAVLINPPVRLKNGENYPFVDMASIEPFSKLVSAKAERKFTGGGSRFKSGDTLMARITPCLENGKIGQFYSDNPTTIAHGSTEFIVIRGRPTVSETEFAYYLTKWEHVRSYAIGQMTGTSGRQRVPVNAFDQLFVPIPSVEEQRAIASLLGALDDKIDLNRRMNETLEAMAQAIFKDWFVDFGPVRAKAEGRPPYLAPEIWALFPDALDDDDKPVGWCIGQLQSLVELNPKELLPQGSIAPYLEMAALSTSGSTPEPYVERQFSSGTRFRNGDTLLARITPCLENGKTAFVQDLPSDAVGWGSTEFIVLRPIPPVPKPYAYILVREANFRTHAIQSMTGTSGRQRARSEALAEYPVAIPNNTDAIWQAFGLVIEPMFERIMISGKESQTLAYLRDLLLPKLMSGEIRLRDAEKAIEEVL